VEGTDSKPRTVWVMPVYTVGEIRERIPDLPATTLWRRLTRLAYAGEIERRVRPGGIGGTLSLVEFPGTLDELAERALPNRPKPKGPHRCPTCGSEPAIEVRDGPTCPRCGKPTVSRGKVDLWCPDCKWGYIRASTTRHEPS
jgi:hypothetical protein